MNTNYGQEKNEAGIANYYRPRFSLLLLVYLTWILITELTPYANRVFDFRRIDPLLLPAIRMTLMLLVTAVFASRWENKPFFEAFNLTLRKPWQSLLWALVFFAVAIAVLAAYQYLLVIPLTQKVLIASGQAHEETVRPFAERLTEYLYIVYEGLVEVIIFIGFLLDRLAKRWGWAAAVIASNIGFALWHYDYWRAGWLNGSLMIILTFLAGSMISLSYVKTKNTLSPIICHTLVDSPSSLRLLLGLM